MCGGGGGSSGTTKYEWNDSLKGPWEGAVNRAIWESERQFEPYMNGAHEYRIAQLTPQHQKAALNMENFADAIGNPTHAINAAQDQATSTLRGDYLSGAGANPYATRNAFSGPNPYHQQVMQQGLDQMASNYQNTTSPELTRLMNMSGALGGSSHVKALANNQANLAKQQSDYIAGMQNDQYNRSAGLEESYLGRGAGAYENERNRMTGSIGAGLGVQDGVMQRLQGLTAMGDMYRGYNQDVLNYGYQNYQDERNENRYGLDFLTGIMSRAQGGFSNVTSQAPQYQISPASALMGGLMAYGAMR